MSPEKKMKERKCRSMDEELGQKTSFDYSHEEDSFNLNPKIIEVNGHLEYEDKSMDDEIF
jgi:hypothetical protein